MKRRTVALLLVCIVGTNILAGCGKKEESAPETTGNKAAVETEAPESEVVDADETETSVSDAADEIETEMLSSESGDSEQSAEGSDITVSGWRIVVENVQVNKTLENISVDLGYTGVETNNVVKEAEDGKTFCLVKLMIEKQGSRETIEWDKLQLTDSNGNTYQRMDDTFITDFGMMRMPGTTLNFGNSEGWIAFEINEDVSGLELSYPFEEEAYSSTLM